MINSVKKIAIIGANGTMGSSVGGLFGQNDFKVYFISRTVEKSLAGLSRAIVDTRSEMITNNIECKDYEEMKKILPECDWIIECLAEDIVLKKEIYMTIDKYRKSGSFISTMTSSLPITTLAAGRSVDFKRYFFGFHLFNPPSKLTLVEIASIEETDKKVLESVYEIAKNRLFRTVVPVRNVPGYVGNRIGFKVFSDVLREINKYGVEMVDYLLGPYTGRALAPLATLDLVGIDTYNAIINSLIKNTTKGKMEFFNSSVITKMINSGLLGNKTINKGGFYKRDSGKKKMVLDINTFEFIPMREVKVPFVENAKRLIREGRYGEAFMEIRNSRSDEADFVLKILSCYVSYSFECIGLVTEKKFGIDGIDKTMANGFNWAPPTVIMKLLGGKKELVKYLNHYSIEIPESLLMFSERSVDYSGYGKYFFAR